MKKIRLTESQLSFILERSVINGHSMDLILESAGNYTAFRNKILNLVRTGAVAATVAIAAIGGMKEINQVRQEKLKMEIAEVAPNQEWLPIANDVIVTVYNAVPSQCNNDTHHTASMFNLNLNDPSSHKIIAMERTMMKEFGLKYGDIVKIVGTYKGAQDGIYQIQDTMNKRYAGKHKIDILSPNDVKTGGTLKGQYATVFVLNDKSKESTYRLGMAPEFNPKNNANKNI